MTIAQKMFVFLNYILLIVFLWYVGDELQGIHIQTLKIVLRK